MFAEMDDAAFKLLVQDAIKSEISALQSNLSVQIGEVKGKLDSHNNDRFAHGWDHHRLVESQATLHDWNGWRRGIDRWRWTMSGALGLLSVMVTTITALLASGHVMFH